MPLTILSVAYSLAAVTRGTPGGAEQILALVDEHLVRAGHRSIVVAAEDSEVFGELAAVPLVGGLLGEEVRRAAHRRHRRVIEHILKRDRVDVVHYHGIDFAAYDVANGVPRMTTLHLPPEWYPRSIFDERGLQLVCVSESERRTAPRCDAVVPNGIDLDAFFPGPVRDYVLAIGRICPEKNFHTAIDAARRAGAPLVIAGSVARYPEHVAYFENEIRPRLGGPVEYIGAVSMPQKRELIAGARAVLIPSTAPETSSIVSMESLACGTPVIAYASGALPEIVEHGLTGIIVHDAMSMAAAIRHVGAISRATCRRVALERFDARVMAARYTELYEHLAR